MEELENVKKCLHDLFINITRNEDIDILKKHALYISYFDLEAAVHELERQLTGNKVEVFNEVQKS